MVSFFRSIQKLQTEDKTTSTRDDHVHPSLVTRLSTVGSDEGTAVLGASMMLFRFRPIGVMSALVLVLSTTEKFTMVFAAAELLVRVIVVVQDVLEAAGDDTLFSPGMH